MSTRNVHTSGPVRKRRTANKPATPRRALAPDSSALDQVPFIATDATGRDVPAGCLLPRRESQLLPESEVDDWLAAEAEIEGQLANGELPTLCGD